jgi:hypothetical protein
VLSGRERRVWIALWGGLAVLGLFVLLYVGIK